MKKVQIAALVLAMMLGLTACGLPGILFPSREAPAGEKETASGYYEVREDGSALYHKAFGSYTVPAGWEENREHSTRDKFFYIAVGSDTGREPPDNISVNSGTNRYSLEEHEQFRDAIMKQLAGQISKQDNTTLNGTGTYTEAGDVLYIFQIVEEDLNITTTQYYIVGDYQYVLVHETTYGDSPETDGVAQAIVNSFSWIG